MLVFKNKPDTSTPINADNLNANFNELNANIGDLNNLETTSKTSAVESINSLKEETIYNVSNSETKCNFKYNGKDVYCKTISIAVPNNTSASIQTNISSDYTIIKMETIGRASNKTTINIPYLSNTNFIRSNIWIAANQYTFELLSNHDASAYIAYATIFYIKE